MRTELRLPYPPSVNSLFSTNFYTHRRFKTKRYLNWIKRAGFDLLAQPQARNKHEGPVVVTLLAHKPDNRRRDIDNLSKAVLDLLVMHQIIRDDSLIRSMHMAWDNSIDEAMVIIEGVV